MHIVAAAELPGASTSLIAPALHGLLPPLVADAVDGGFALEGLVLPLGAEAAGVDFGWLPKLNCQVSSPLA